MKPGNSESTIWLSRSGVADLFQVSPNTVTRWAHEGKLPYQLTLGGHHRFDRRVVEELSRTLRASAGAGPAASMEPARRAKRSGS